MGYELEFSGLSLDEASAAVGRAFGAEVKHETAAERSVTVEPFGGFTITIDWQYLERTAEEDARTGEHATWVRALGDTAALVVPMEVVCPPVPVERMHELDPMVDELRATGARGTGTSMIAAYGLHINVEPPALHAQTLNRYIQAFGLLQYWLEDRLAIDTTRQLSPYIDRWPDAYVAESLSPTAPDQDALIDHYLVHNASRNRALDLLPLFAELDDERVHAVIDDSLLKPRPAFHFRLPNCEIERPDWGLPDPWNAWWTVEQLVANPPELARLADDFTEAIRPVLGLDHGEWRSYTDRWLRDREWV